MKQSVLAVTVTGLLAAGAGVAIAGLPGDLPGGDLVIRDVPTTTVVAPVATVAPLATDTGTDVADATSTSGAEPAATETAATETAATETTATETAATETTVTEPAATETTDLAGSGDGETGSDEVGSDDDRTDAVDPIVSDVPRDELDVATANAGGVGGIAGAAADALARLGYEVQPADAVQLSDTSVVYFADGFEAEAARLAADLGWTIGDTAPMSTMPALRTGRSFHLVAVIGTDRA